MSPESFVHSDVHDLEDFVLRFERAAYDEQVPLASYVPDSGHPKYQDVAVEICRVELELSRKRGSPRTVQDLIFEFPWLKNSPRYLAVLQEESNRLSSHVTQEFVKTEAKKPISWPPVPSRLKQFYLEKELGRGSFARVYLASQEDLANRRVVIKVTKKRTQEPERLAQLQHENIVPIYSVQAEQGLHILCMPFVGTRTLASILKVSASVYKGNTLGQNSPVPSTEPVSLTEPGTADSTVARGGSETLGSAPTPIIALPSSAGISRREKEPSAKPGQFRAISEDQALKWSIDLARGLAHAHNQGTVHGDIKPANLLVTDADRLMLLDFNLAADAFSDAPSFGDGAHQRHVGGTPAYMAPEHLEGARLGMCTANQATDVYTAGLVMFEMLAGRRPFPLDRLDEANIRQRLAGPPTLSKEECQSSDLAAIVGKCLAPRAEDRYPSAIELLTDLQRHADNQRPVLAPGRDVHEGLAKWRRRHPRLSSSGAVAAVALVLICASVAWSLHLRSGKLDAQAAMNWKTVQAKLPAWIVDLTCPILEPRLREQSLAKADDELHSTGLHFDDMDGAATPATLGRLSETDRKAAARELTKYYFYRLVAELKHVSEMKPGADRDKLRADTIRRMESLQDIAHTEYATAAALACHSLSKEAGDQDSLSSTLRTGNSPKLLKASHSDADSLDIPLVLQAAILLHDGNAQGALGLLDPLVGERASDYSEWTLRGSACYQLGRWEEAAQAFTVAYALAPHSQASLYSRAMCHMQLEEYAQALADWESVTLASGGDSAFLVNKAVCCIRLKHYQKAIAILDQVLQDGDGPSRAYALRSEAYTALGDHDRSAKDFQSLLKTEPKDEASWVARGYARMRKDPDGAVQDFQQALQLNPNSHPALRNLSYVYDELQHKPEQARATMDQLVQAAPWDSFAWAGRGVMSARRGDYPSALKDAEHALSLSKQPLSLLQAACIYSLASQKETKWLAKARELTAQAVIQQKSLLDIVLSDPDLGPLREADGFNDWFQTLTAASDSR